jgi:formylglycine-generating enzyme required for sulfatase activity
MCLRVTVCVPVAAALGLIAGSAVRSGDPERPPKEVANSVGMKLVLIPGGKFVMGMPKTEKILYENEAEHEVEITGAFYLGAFEVTQGQYEKVMGDNPSRFSPAGPGKDKVRGVDTKSFPVEGVDWAKAVEFCKMLSALPGEAKAGRKYRLPTEAEWEYACRAGTTTRFAFGDELTLEQANFDGRFLNEGPRPAKWLGRTTEVGSYKPNAWGLYDMHGNVWEWCADWYQPGYYAKSPKKDPPGPEKGDAGRRVRRGGDFAFFGLHARSGARFPYQSDKNGTGFRVVCEISSP